MATEQIERINSTNWSQQMLRDMYTTGELADVTFICGLPDEPKTNLKGHSLVLGMASEVFKAMFYGLNSRREQDNTFKVEIADIDSTTFSALLKYVYLRELDIDNAGDAFRLYVAADKYFQSELKANCFEYIKHSVSHINALSILKFAVATDNTELKDILKGVMNRISKQELIHGQFLELEPQVVKFFLSYYRLGIKQIDLLHLVLKWCNKHLGKGRPGPRICKIREILIKSGIINCLDISRLNVATYLAVFQDSGLMVGDHSFHFLFEMFVNASGMPKPGVSRLSMTHDFVHQKFIYLTVPIVKDKRRVKLKGTSASLKVVSTKDITLSGIWTTNLGDIKVFSGKTKENEKHELQLLFSPSKGGYSQHASTFLFDYGLDIRANCTYNLEVELSNVVEKLFDTRNGKLLKPLMYPFHAHQVTHELVEGDRITASAEGFWPAAFGFVFNKLF